MTLDLCSLSHEDLYGTTVSGNLPVNKRNRDGVDISKAGYCWKLCPYSTDNTTHSGYVKTNHTQTKGRMQFYSKGSKPGWICWDDNCYYFTTELPNRRYFES